MKRIIALSVLFLVLIFSVTALTACDKNEITSVGLKFKLNEDRQGYTLVGVGTCDDEHVIIDTHRKKPITAIADGVFNGNNEIKAVTIGNTVKTVGKYAFAECDSLEEVNIGISLETIEANAFYSCDKLKKIDLPNSLISIGSYAFEYCTSLSDVSFGKSLGKIGSYAFYSCHELRSAIFGDALRTVGQSAFVNCMKLKTVKFGTGLQYIDVEAFSGCAAIETLEFAPSNMAVGKQAFKHCSSLRSVSFPEGAKTIGTAAFSYCTSLEKIDFGPTLSNIDSEAFTGCTALKDVSVPANVARIGAHSFKDCTSLESMTLPYIGNTATSGGAHLGNIFGSIDATYVPESLKRVHVYGMSTIPAYAFDDCIWLEEVTFGDGVKIIGGYAFDGCVSLRNVVFSDSITHTGNFIFRGCIGLERIEFGTGIRSIGSSAFYETVNLREVHIKDLKAWYGVSLSNIYSTPFGYNADLYVDGERITELTVPKNVKNVQNYVFYGANLTRINIHRDLEYVGALAFEGGPNLVFNEYAGGKYLGCEDDPYIFLAHMTDYDSTAVTINPTTKIIGRASFLDCARLTKLIIPESVEIIGNYAFEGCTSLMRVSIGGSVRSIGYEIFRECESLMIVQFQDTYGWRVSPNSGMIDATEMTPEQMLDSASMAQLMSDTYLSCYWKKTVTEAP